MVENHLDDRLGRARGDSSWSRLGGRRVGVGGRGGRSVVKRVRYSSRAKKRSGGGLSLATCCWRLAAGLKDLCDHRRQGHTQWRQGACCSSSLVKTRSWRRLRSRSQALGPHLPRCRGVAVSRRILPPASPPRSSRIYVLSATDCLLVHFIDGDGEFISIVAKRVNDEREIARS